MKKKMLFILLLISVCTFILGIILSEPLKFGFCHSSYSAIEGGPVVGCLDDTSAGDALGIFSLIIVLIILTLFFVKEEVQVAWKKFALWWVPISALFIIGAPSSSGSGLDSFSMGMDRESITWFFAVLFLLISIILIIYKSIKLRKS